MACNEVYPLLQYTYLVNTQSWVLKSLHSLNLSKAPRPWDDIRGLDPWCLMRTRDQGLGLLPPQGFYISSSRSLPIFHITWSQILASNHARLHIPQLHSLTFSPSCLLSSSANSFRTSRSGTLRSSCWPYTLSLSLEHYGIVWTVRIALCTSTDSYVPHHQILQLLRKISS